MSAAWRLFRIEARRSVALWFAPIVAALAWYAARDAVQDGVTLWATTSASIGRAVIVAAPLMGGAAAWVAGRNRRRGIEELLATTPRPAAPRDLVSWAAALVWGLLAYLAAGATTLTLAARDATWGTPSPFPMVVGLGTLVAATALGYLAGLWVPSRFTASLAAAGLLVALAMPIPDPNANYQRLSPWFWLDPGDYLPYHRAWSEQSLALLPWLGGIVGLALAGIALRREWSRRTLAVGAVSAIMAAVAALPLLNVGLQLDWRASDVAYQPVCRDGAVQVCGHPAYVGMFDDLASAAEPLLRPLDGVPGAPTRLRFRTPGERSAENAAGLRPDGTLVTAFYPGNSSLYEAQELAAGIVCDPRGDYDSCPYPMFFDPLIGRGVRVNFAQFAVSIWLLRQAGYAVDLDTSSAPVQGADPATDLRRELSVAAERFGALSSEQRHAWFTQYYRNLWAGHLALSDLP